MRSRSILLLVAAITLPASAAAPVQGDKEASRAIVIGWSFDVGAPTLGSNRRINVYLPEHYADPTRKFRVLFLLDGGEKEDFQHIAALAQITAANGEGDEMIVVGIEGVDRRHDLTSPSTLASDLKAAPTSGGSAAYLRFLRDDLKPWVDARYRTSGRTAIIGESLAGLFVLHALLDRPDSFDDYIAISPSLWWNGGHVIDETTAAMTRSSFAGKRLWVAFEVPPPPAAEAQKDVARQAALRAALGRAQGNGLHWTAVNVDEGHRSVYHPAAWQALRALYALPSSASGGPPKLTPAPRATPATAIRRSTPAHRAG
ncbi:MAG: alpha/beta hydrolase-fold protein [Sphingomonas sp.]